MIRKAWFTLMVAVLVVAAFANTVLAIGFDKGGPWD